jgi:arylsulfatase A-like enzyme
MKVIVLLADGARADWFASALNSGAVPSLARLRDEGALHAVATVFPSVTGMAYAPFLMGRFPGGVGLPGLRWFDRARTRCRWPDYCRSYTGYQYAYATGDIDPRAPTIYELVPRSVGILSPITRGLSSERKSLSLTPRSALRALRTHYFGSAADMLKVDREVATATVERAGEVPYLFAAFGSIDKLSHAEGHQSPRVLDALRIVDTTVAAVRDKLERRAEWNDTRVWITSDHGHSPVSRHEDLERVVRGLGFRVIAHPWTYGIAPEVAVMVSGNAMAHVYVDLAKRERPFIRGMSDRARALADQLLDLPSVDLVITPLSETSSEVHSLVGGHAIVSRDGGRYSYARQTGDPLSLGRDLLDLSRDDAQDACASTLYPDAIVQIAELVGASRSGDIILSAAPEWDFRSRYEPIPHVSTHGSLRREHMEVPLLMSHRPARTPRRTTDLFPSSLTALGCSIPDGLDGLTFE